MKSFFIVILLDENGRYVQATRSAWDTPEAASHYMESINPLYHPRVVKIVSAEDDDD